MTTTLDTIAMRIIKEQELVIGPLAWTAAKKVRGLKITDNTRVQIESVAQDQKNVVDQLVAQYERLFGRASHEVCREAAASLIGELQPTDIPSSLR